MKSIKKAILLFKPFWTVYTVQLFLVILISSITLIWPYVLGLVIDALYAGRDLQYLLSLCALVLFSQIGATILEIIKDRNEIKNLDFKLGMHTGLISLRKIFSLSVGQLTHSHSGFRQTVFSKGERALSDIVGTITFELLPVFFRFIFPVIAIFWINPIIGSVVIVFSIFQIISYLRINLSYFDRLHSFRKIDNELGKYESEVYRSATTILLNGQENLIAKKFEDKYKDVNDVFVKVWGSLISKVNLCKLWSDISTVIVIVLGVYQSLVWGVYSPGIIVAVFAWTMRASGTAEQFSYMTRRLLLKFPDMEKYFAMLDIQTDIEQSENSVRPEIKGKIEFKKVFFSHPVSSIDTEGDNPKEEEEEEKNSALKKVSFIINPGETCAFVGHSGAGKTTIINLLLRVFDPEEGQVLIDDISLKDFDLNYWRSNIGYVEQSVVLFDETLKENILFGVSEKDKEKWNEERLDDLAKQTRIDQFYSRLGTKRFNTIIGENGVKLSGGERQRVGIARALAKDPKVLIFDEATSSLDAENEAIIQETVKDALKGRTGIIIAHRLSTIFKADKIIVLDQGSIIDMGKHKELLTRCEKYKELVNRQLSIGKKKVF